MARKQALQATKQQRKSASDKSPRARPGLSDIEGNDRRVMPWARSVHGAATVARMPKQPKNSEGRSPAAPDLFDVITYFRARGDSYALIANIGFWTKDNPGKALTARGLKAWYEAELQRRRPAKPARQNRP
jgi:hypothetical protein